VVGHIHGKSSLATKINIGTEEYSLAQQYVFKLIKPGYMFHLLQPSSSPYLQSLVKLHTLNAYTVWDPSSKAKTFTDGIKNMNHSVG
jgi:hypothetical protein